LWVPAFVVTLVAQRHSNERFTQNTGCHPIANNYDFNGTFNDNIRLWTQGVYPTEFVPSGVDPLRILHDRFPE
jgi:hypothetical protein